MINKVILVGRITRDPELKYTSSNIPYVQFTLAVNRTFQSRDGNREADFINCTVWRTQAENLARYIKKGALLGAEGSIQVNSYDDNNGVRRSFTTVVCDNIQFLEPKASSGTSDYSSPYDDVHQPTFPRQNNYQQSSNRSNYGPKPQSPTQRNPFEDVQMYGQSNPKPSFFESTKEPESREHEENPFEDVGNYDVSNDDLPF